MSVEWAEKEIFEIAKNYRKKLEEKINERKLEMKKDDISHYFIYSVLGIKENDGEKIDIHQNIGRFLYKYAGSFLEETAIICLKSKFPDAQKVKIPNKLSGSPKTFEIDCLVGNEAIEVKWRDATTDGDHINKEHRRIEAIKNEGLTPIRIMFFRPNRKQAQKIQERLKAIYEEVNGEFYVHKAAWDYLKRKTDIDLNNVLEKIIKKTKMMEI